MRVHFASVKGVQTRYYQGGSGPPLLLVHGVGVIADSWIKNIDQLGEVCTVYAPDLLGSGFTAHGAYDGGPPQPYLVEHLVDFVDQLGIERFAVVGSSLGALISALLYFRLPERVTKLIVVNCGSLLGDYGPQLRPGIERSRENGRLAFANPTRDVCLQRMGNICYDVGSVPEEVTVTQMTAHALPGAAEAYEQRMAGLLDFAASTTYSVGHRLREITVPKLVIWGKNDPRGSFERAIEQFAELPDTEIVGIEACGHLPHLEHPEQFNAAARRFLSAPS